MAGQSWTVGQEQLCKNCQQFKNVTEGQMDGPTDTARCRVARPRLKKSKSLCFLPGKKKKKEKRDEIRYIERFEKACCVIVHTVIS